MAKNSYRYWMTHVTVLAAMSGLLVLVPGVKAEEKKVDILRQLGDAFSEISAKAMPAVVFIQVEKSIGGGKGGGQYFYNNPADILGDEFMRRFFGMPEMRPNSPGQYRQVGQGSGFLITKDGYILTNNHVVGDADRITVTLNNGRTYTATRIGSDSKSEVAVIQIEGDDFPCLELGDSDELAIGEWVLAIGNPFGLAESVTAGIVSAKGRSNVGIADYENFIQTDAAINPGNSGGPLLNIDGRVVGINTAIYSRTGGYMGIGFAVPINMARDIKDQLLENGRVVRGYLGVRIQTIDGDMATSFDLKDTAGILISDVVENSAAAKGGLKEGDVILDLDGKPVESVNSFRNTIASRAPGTEVRLRIHRDGQNHDLRLKTGELPADGDVTKEAVGGATDKLGFSAVDVSPEIARQTGYHEGDGVVVSDVTIGGLAWRAGIREGALIMSVNRRPVANMKDFTKVMGDAEAGQIVLLKVRDGDSLRYLTLRLE